MEHPELMDVDEENFSYIFFNTFTVINSSRQEKALLPHGEDIPVTWENRLQFCHLALHYRLHEFDPQLEAIKTGFHEIVSPHIIKLFTWKELQLRVCGVNDIDLVILKKNTLYFGLDKNSNLVEMFWNVLASFTKEQRCGFIRFVWGRSRLPPSSTEFDRKFELHSFERHTGSQVR